MRRSALLLLAVISAGCAREKQQPVTKATSHPTFTTPELSRAESLYFAAEYDSAAQIWQRVLASDSVKKDSAAQAHILMWLGMREWRLGNYDSARVIGERSLALKLRLGRTRELSRSYNSLGLIARDQGRLIEAKELFLKAMETARAVSDTAGINRGAINLALVLQDLGEFGEAQKGFVTARDAGRALGDARLEGNALNNLGALLIKMGDPQGAIPVLHDAIARYASIEYNTGLQNSIGQLATAYDALGDSERAFVLLDSASKMAAAQGLKQEQENNLRIFGELYQAAGDHQRALDFFGRARALSTELGLGQETGIILRAEARSQIALGRTDIGLARIKEALAAHQTEKALFEEMTDLLDLSELSSGVVAKRYVDEARAIAEKINTPSARADVALGAARFYARSSNWRRVVEVVDSADASVRNARAAGMWEAHALKARAYAKLGILDSAVMSGREAVAATERVRNRIAAGSLRTTFTSERSLIYADLVIALLRMNKPAEALAVADAARGRELLEHLAEAGSDVTREGPVDLAQREKLLRQINELTHLLSEADRVPQRERGRSDDERITALATKLSALENEYEVLVTKSARQSGIPSDLLDARNASLDRVSQSLHPDEALIEYMVTPERLLIFVVRNGRLVQLSSEVTEAELAGRVRVARGIAGKRDINSQDNAVFRGLHAILIAPAEKAGALRDVRRIVLVPHGALVYLPFAALIDNKERYLSDTYAILHSSSASALSALRSRTSARTSSRRTVVLAPFPERLPSTRQEAQDVRRSVPSSQVLIGPRATERALRNALREARIVHVASHGFLNRRNPLFSRVELAPPVTNENHTSADDGRLDVHELFGLNIGAQLVFLSGCETGVGTAWSTDFSRGDDFATLAQAFLYSGAREVVATLWRLDDEAAAIFAGSFYKNLKTLPPADALAAAQSEVKRDSRLRAPYYWASYTVSGSGDRLNLEKVWWNPFK